MKTKYSEVSRGEEITGTLFLISLIFSSIFIIETQYHYEVQYWIKFTVFLLHHHDF